MTDTLGQGSFFHSGPEASPPEGVNDLQCFPFGESRYRLTLKLRANEVFTADDP
jgi:hypothetical protein